MSAKILVDRILAKESDAAADVTAADVKLQLRRRIQNFMDSDDTADVPADVTAADVAEKDTVKSEEGEDSCLTRQEMDMLIAISKNPSLIKSAEIVDEWSDDRLLCVRVKVNGVEFDIWHTSASTIACFDSPDSEKARKKIAREVKDKLEAFEFDGIPVYEIKN